MIPKTVVFAPIPRTRARKATMEKAGYLTSIRKAKRRSFIIIIIPNVGLELGQREWRGGLGSDTRAVQQIRGSPSWRRAQSDWTPRFAKVAMRSNGQALAPRPIPPPIRKSQDA